MTEPEALSLQSILMASMIRHHIKIQRIWATCKSLTLLHEKVLCYSADMIFLKTKVSKLVHNVEGIVADRNLEWDALHSPACLKLKLRFVPIHRRSHISRLALDCTKGSTRNAEPFYTIFEYNFCFCMSRFPYTLALSCSCFLYLKRHLPQFFAIHLVIVLISLVEGS